jgi:hypothetical protein
VQEEQSPYLQPILLGKRAAVTVLDRALIAVATPHAVALSRVAPKKFSTLLNRTVNSKFCLLAYIYLTRRSEHLRDSGRPYPCVACCGLGAVGAVGGAVYRGCASRAAAEAHLVALTADGSPLAPQKAYSGRNSLTQVKDCVVQATLQLAEDLLLANRLITGSTKRSAEQVFATWTQLTETLSGLGAQAQLPNASELDMLYWLLQHCPSSEWRDGSRLNKLFGVTSPTAFGACGDWHAHTQCLMALAIVARRESPQQPEAELEASALADYRARYPNETPPPARRKRSAKAQAKAIRGE